MRLRIALTAFLLVAWACGSSEEGTDAASTPDKGVTYDQGSVEDALADAGPKKLHGEACTQDYECKYGLCYSSPTVTKDQFKICTKSCQGAGTTPCNVDGDYTCAIFGTTYDETVVAFCVPVCDTVADCKALDSRYNACGHPVGAVKFCYVD